MTAPISILDVNGEPSQYWGWVPPECRTREESAQVANVMASLPTFQLSGTFKGDKVKVGLYEARQKIAKSQHPPTINQSTGSCFPAGTLVRMADGGEKPIESVLVGDRVVTHTGASRTVVERMKRTFSGKMVTIHVASHPFPLRMTEDHPVAVMRTRCSWRWHPDYLEWVKAGDLSEDDRVLIGLLPSAEDPVIDVAPLLGPDVIVLDDLVAGRPVPLNKPEAARQACLDSGFDYRGRVRMVDTRLKNAIHGKIRVTPSFARLLGLYLADGGVNDDRVTFTFGAKKEHLADEAITLVEGIFGVHAEKIWSERKATVVTVRVPNANVARVFKSLIPGNVYTKRVPGFLMAGSADVRHATLLGWMACDGYAAMHGGSRPASRIQGVSVCAGLIRDMQALALSLGIKTSCGRRRPRNQSREAFDIYLSGPKILESYPELREQVQTVRQRPLTTVETARTRFGHCRTIRRIETETVADLQVFDFEVEEDHSFVAEGIVVHNCVGAGGGNCVLTLRDVEIVLGGKLAEPEMIWWLYTYGESRELSGMRSRGDGSTGAGYAKAITTKGTFSAAEPGLPQFTMRNGWYYLDPGTERQWSDGQMEPGKWDPLAAKHLVKSAAQCRSAEDVATAIQNGYPCTVACMFGTRGQKRVDGDQPVMVSEWDGSWAHQQYIDAWWNHPTEGELFRVGNNWGPDAHSPAVDGSPNGGYWVRKATVQRMCGGQEVFALSAFEGFPARELDWAIL